MGFLSSSKIPFHRKVDAIKYFDFNSTRKTLTKQVPQKAAEMVRGLEQTAHQQLGWFRQRKRADTNQNGLKSVLKGEFSAPLLQLSLLQCYLLSPGIAVGLTEADRDS